MSDAPAAVVIPNVPVIMVPAPPPTDALVEAWYQETFCNLGLTTELQNRFRLAADALKARLAAVK